MPSYKNEFGRPSLYDHDIVDEDGKVGTIRVKPSGIAWKPKNGQKFYSISLTKFADWIMENGRKTKS